MFVTETSLTSLPSASLLSLTNLVDAWFQD